MGVFADETKGVFGTGGVAVVVPFDVVAGAVVVVDDVRIGLGVGLMADNFGGMTIFSPIVTESSLRLLADLSFASVV